MGRFAQFVGDRLIDALVEYGQRPGVQERAEIAWQRYAPAEAAQRVARRDSSDEDALAELRADIAGADVKALNASIDWLGALRVDYVTDRAFRLLSAFRDNAPIRPIDPAVRQQFVEELRLGRMPLSNAVEQLVQLQPRLRANLDDAIAHASRTNPSPEIARQVLGPRADTTEPVVKTDFAVNLVKEYIREQSGTAPARPSQDPDTPFFDRRRSGVYTSFFPFGIGDRRPRAKN
jgi:hypothetical protein